jgi:hypothetical protein
MPRFCIGAGKKRTKGNPRYPRRESHVAGGSVRRETEKRSGLHLKARLSQSLAR